MVSEVAVRACDPSTGLVTETTPCRELASPQPGASMALPSTGPA